LNGAKDFDGGEYKLPYDNCVFEFMVTGLRVIYDASQGKVYFKSQNTWWVDEGYLGAGTPIYLDNQVRAICIAMEAKAATGEEVEAPAKLNKQRLAKGVSLVSKFVMIRLNSKRKGCGGEYKGIVRLHFRRGHWRHYENTKKWIAWMLVGNPDLGYIDKYYKI
jgi:hypothetical protein